MNGLISETLNGLTPQFQNLPAASFEIEMESSSLWKISDVAMLCVVYS